MFLRVLRKNLYVVLIVFSMIRCTEGYEETYYYLDLGTVETITDPNYQFRIKLDNGRKLYPNDYNSAVIIPGDGERIITEYTIIRQKSETDSTEFIADFHAIEEVLNKDILQLTPAIEDSIGNDLVMLDQDDIWIADSFLNIVFEYLGDPYSSPPVIHYINLVKPADLQTDTEGRQILEFRHNANNDYPNFKLRGIVSFNLESLKTKGDTAVNFVVNAKVYGVEDFSWEGSYQFIDRRPSKDRAYYRNSFSGYIE